MNFDEWWKTNGIEMATYEEKSAARKGWNASKQIEREECAKICNSLAKIEEAHGENAREFASINCAKFIRSKA